MMNRKELVIYAIELFDKSELCNECKYKDKKTKSIYSNGCSRNRCISVVLKILKRKKLLED